MWVASSKEDEPLYWIISNYHWLAMLRRNWLCFGLGEGILEGEWDEIGLCVTHNEVIHWCHVDEATAHSNERSTNAANGLKLTSFQSSPVDACS